MTNLMCFNQPQGMMLPSLGYNESRRYRFGKKNHIFRPYGLLEGPKILSQRVPWTAV